MDARRSRLARLALLGIVSAVLVGSVVTTLPAPVAALDGDSGATYTNPRAPGGEGRYTVTVVAERNDTIGRNGLQESTLDFGADGIFPATSHASPTRTSRSTSKVPTAAPSRSARWTSLRRVTERSPFASRRS